MTEAEARLEAVKAKLYVYMADCVSLTPYHVRALYDLAEGRPWPLAPVMTAEQCAEYR